MLADITPYTDLVQELDSLFENIDDEDEKEIVYPEYTRKDFLKDVYMSEEDYNRLTGVLCNKKNIILQGAPGVGKTYLAKRLAYSIMGVKDVERVKMVQFHQSYSYEDFIMGFRPTLSGFELKKTSVYKGYKRDKIEMRGDRAEISDFPLYLNTVAGGLDCRDQTIGGFSFVVKIYAVPVVEIIG